MVCSRALLSKNRRESCDTSSRPIPNRRMSIKLNFASSFKQSYPASEMSIRKTHPIIADSLTVGKRKRQFAIPSNPMTSRISTQPASLLWPAHGLPVEIRPEEVHVWAWTFTGPEMPSEADLEILDDPERKRTARYYFAPDRVRFSVCHSNMRRILGSYLGKPPESLVYREAEG